jgi:Rrf2 family protein
MKLSAKSDYAARAILGLARRYHTGESLRVEDLAAEQGIPPNYLVQILIELKSQQIVKSVRGKEGGYLLARSPAEITMADLLRCVHGQVFDSPAFTDAQCPPELRGAWKQLQKAVDDAANGITFQKLLEMSLDKEKMYYI